MVSEVEKKIIMKFSLHGNTFKNSEKSVCKEWLTRKNSPIMRKKSVTQKSLHVCDISEVQKSKK